MYSYIHIPFCESKCKYCRFASTASLDRLKIQNYVEHIINEIKNFNRPLLQKSGLKSVYFGGGTPSILSQKQISQILETLKNKFIFDKNIEITLESTPQNITSESLIAWKNLGINRLSMGVQTLNNESLKILGRDSCNSIFIALDLLTKANFENVSLDFIIGLPLVGKGELKKDIEFILDNYTFVKHISVYMLEEFYYSFNSGISEDDFVSEYNEIRDFLNQKGFNFYELSNSAKLGYECRHNKAYWDHSEMLAFGLGAHGFVENSRYSNSSKFKDYYAGKLEYEEQIGTKEMDLEKIMFAIRTDGIDIKNISKLNKNKIENFISDGFLEIKDDKLILTRKSYSLVDFIVREII